MTLPGECVGDTKAKCWECENEMDIGVYQSAAGFYIGFFCENCGPYSRESGYYPSREHAQSALDSDSYFRL